MILIKHFQKMFQTKILGLFLIFLTICFKYAENANILFVAISPSHSHQVMFQPVWKELSLRGHNVVAITPNPLNDTKLNNLTEIDISTIYDIKKNINDTQLRDMLLKRPDFLTVFLKDSIMTYYFNILNEMAFSNTNMQTFLKQEHKFDVVIVEWLFPTMAAFGAKFNAPIIGITSLGAPIPSLDTVGNPSHPIFAPDHNLPVTRDMPFKERLMSGLWAVYVRLFYHSVVLPREDKLVKKYLGQELPYLGDIERNISLLLLNRNPVFHRVYPVVPAIIELGFMKKPSLNQTLDNKLKKFLDNSNKGVVYFSLGSNMKVSWLSEKVLDSLRNTFKKLPYNILLKWETDDDPKMPSNVLAQKWFPQSAVLSHQNVKLFITQGGLQSSEEAILRKVPIIGIPFFSDQTANVDSMETFGMGKMLLLEDITEKRLTSYITEVITNPSYKENAVKLSQLLQDQPVDGLQKAVWWIEYVIRHKGAKHLRSPAMDVPWYIYLMLDIMGVILAVLSIIGLILYGLIKLILKILRCIFCRRCNEKNIKKKKE